ncbi:MAG: hypothetical protein EXS00_04915 [Phycisphaerales bacterium]|nr:hypothetical protein [Phycisphaerales bacterium]
MSFGLSRGKKLDLGTVGLSSLDLPAAEVPRLDASWFFPGRETTRPFELEIGSGKATFLLEQSGLEPGTDFLGVEYAGEFYRYGADRLRRHQRTNVRLLYSDANEFVQHRLADRCVTVIHLYFSDPWPKTRHHKRRVVQDATVAQFHRVLAQGGELRLVTDHDDLWTWYEQHAARALAAGLFAQVPFVAPSAAREGELVGSNFERKYAPLGRKFRAMTWKRLELPPTP